MYGSADPDPYHIDTDPKHLEKTTENSRGRGLLLPGFQRVQPLGKWVTVIQVDVQVLSGGGGVGPRLMFKGIFDMSFVPPTVF